METPQLQPKGESAGDLFRAVDASLTACGMLKNNGEPLMKVPSNLIPQKAVADDLCVSLVTLWRARQSKIPGFPEPVMLRNMIFWRREDIQQLEEALLKFEGRGKFEEGRLRSERNANLLRSRLRARRATSRTRTHVQQMDLF